MDNSSSGNKSFSLSELLVKLDKLTKEVNQLKSSFFNKEKLNAFFYTAPVPMVTVDRDCIILFANKAFLNLIGRDSENLVGEQIADLLDASPESDEVKENIINLFDGEIEKYNKKLKFKISTGSKGFFEISARAVEYNDEIKKAVHITLQDRSQEEKFREAYRSIVENSLQAILIVQDFQIIFANERAAEICGYTIDELKKLDIKGVKSLVHPEDRERLFELMKLPFSDKKVSPKQEFRGVRKDNSVYWLEVLVSYMNYNGRPALQIVQLDISDKKLAETEVSIFENKYISLVEQSIIGVYIITDGTFAYVNPRLASIFGYEQSEVINKLSPQDVVHPDDWPVVEENLRKRMSGEVESLHYEFRGIKKSGRIIYIEVHGSRTIFNRKVSIQGMLQDISERKEAEEKVYLQSAALNSAANGIVITDKRGSIVYCNPAFTTLTGYTFDEIIGKNPRILKSGKHDKAFYQNIWKTVLAGGVWEGEIINKKKDGTEFIERQTITPVLGQDSDIEYFIAIKNDITESKKTENALKESEQKLRNIIEHSNELYYIHDTNNILSYASPQCQEMLGYSQKELHINWTKLTTDNPINLEGIKITERAIKTGNRQEEYLLELKRKDDNKIYAQVSESPLKNSEGKVVGMAGALRNVTEKMKAEEALRESEERFRGLYENAILGIYRTSTDGEILMANPALCKLLGYESFEEFKELQASEALYADFSTRECFREIIDATGEVYGFETMAVRKDGTRFPMRESARAVKDGKGDIQYYEGIIEDVTNQKLGEEKLIEAKNSAEQSDKLKTEFLAQMSHEIRTPINVILSFSNLIRDEVRGLISNELLNSFSIIDNASRRMIRTIDLILNMSQLQTGSYQAKMDYIDVNKDVLIPLYPEFSRLANEKNLKLVINKNVEDSTIFADEYSVRQVFDNLIHNAIKYTLKGGVELSIEKGMDSKLLVIVADSGIGISEQYLPNLFKPFTQEEHGYTRRYEGNGLGLALVSRYCELNKAEITVESKKNKGTTFTLSFPTKG